MSGDDVRRDATVIGVVSFAHGYSHFAHLLVAPLFPWLQPAFGLSYAELGLLMTVFFVVSGIGQAAAGFVVDRFGAVPALLVSVALFVLAATGFAASPSYPMLIACAALAGLGNASFHPIDYSILNAKIPVQRLGMSYAVHGIAGNLGWAAAPVFLAGIATLAGWRVAFLGAALLAALVWTVVWSFRGLLAIEPGAQRASGHGSSGGSGSGSGGGGGNVSSSAGDADGGAFGFLRLPAVWLSFAFFVVYALALGGVQSFGPEAARQLHEVPLQWAALCLTCYMLASAAGMVWGGVLARDPRRADRLIGIGFVAAGAVALTLALTHPPGLLVPALFAAMGLGAGVAGPSRDLLVRAATPPGATGRVYGMVYSGLDIGMACAPLVFGLMMDAHRPAAVWVGIAVFQALLIVSVLRLGSTVRRDAAVRDTAAV